MLGASFGKKLSFENPRVVGYLPSKVVEVWGIKDEEVIGKIRWERRDWQREKRGKEKKKTRFIMKLPILVF
jgi:hypothetical protein